MSFTANKQNQLNQSNTNFKAVSNNTSLYNSKSKNAMNEYNDMDIGRIREFISILEEHQSKCEKSKKFVDAEIAKQKVAQLKQVEKDKCLTDLKFNHEDEIRNFEIEKNNAFNDFNTEWDSHYKELMEKFSEFEQRLKIQQQEDLNTKIIEFDKKFYPIVKPTSEILNLTKILNGLIRQKEYIKAHQIQNQINQLANFDNSQYLMEKEKRLAKEVDKIKQKHFQEYQVLVAKKELTESEHLKNRQTEFDKMVQGFKNRLKEIELHHNFELMQITNPKRYLARNITKSKSGMGSSRLHSSASVDKLREKK